jgi:hypothetical protein
MSEVTTHTRPECVARAPRQPKGPLVKLQSLEQAVDRPANDGEATGSAALGHVGVSPDPFLLRQPRPRPQAPQHSVMRWMHATYEKPSGGTASLTDSQRLHLQGSAMRPLSATLPSERGAGACHQLFATRRRRALVGSGGRRVPSPHHRRQAELLLREPEGRESQRCRTACPRPQ